MAAAIAWLREENARVWAEYDRLAAWCARPDSPLPVLSVAVACLVADDPEAFAERVRLTAYARAREGTL